MITTSAELHLASLHVKTLRAQIKDAQGSNLEELEAELTALELEMADFVAKQTAPSK